MKLPLQLFFPAAEQGVQQGVELRAVILIAEVAEFVEEDIVLQVLRQEDQAHVEVDVAFGRAGAPVGDVVLDSHPAFESAARAASRILSSSMGSEGTEAIIPPWTAF